MREDVRALILARPALIRQLRGADAGPLLVAAPYLRIDGDRWQLPGGPAAAPVWTALSGAASEAPEPRLLALLRADGGLLAYLVELVASLSPEQQRSRLALADADERRRVAAGVELLDGVRAVAHGWQIRDRPFWRPSADPAFLLGAIARGARRAGCRCPAAACSGRSPSATAPCRAGEERGPRGLGRSDAGLRRVAAGADLDRGAGGSADPLRAGAVRVASPRRCRGLAGGGGRDDPARLCAATRSSCACSIAWTSTTCRGSRRWSAAPTAWSRPPPGWRGHAAVVRWQSALGFLDHMARLGAIERDELRARPRRAGRSRVAAGVARDAGPGAARRARRRRGRRRSRRRSGGAPGRGRAGGASHAQPHRRRPPRHLGRPGLSASTSAPPSAIASRASAAATGRPRLDAAWAVFALSDCAQRAGRRGSGRPSRPGRGGDPPRSDAGASTSGSASRPARRWRPPGALARSRPRRARLGRDPRLRSTISATRWPPRRSPRWPTPSAWAGPRTCRCPRSPPSAGTSFTKPSPVGTLDASWLPPDIHTARGSAWHVVGSLLGLGRRAGAGRPAPPVAEAAGGGAEPEHGRSPLARDDGRRARPAAISPTTRSGELAAAFAAGRRRLRRRARRRRRRDDPWPRRPARHRSGRRWPAGWRR